MSRIRTFIAVTATDKVNQNLRRLLVQLSGSSFGNDYRWAEPENLHLTLNFLGDLPDREIPEFCREVKGAVEPLAPFEMSLEGLGWFPKPEQPRILWIGVEQGNEALKTLHRTLFPVCERWCSNNDRTDFIPHLTLGRLKKDSRWNDAWMTELDRMKDFKAGNCLVDRVMVYSSYLDNGGPSYTPMATIKLKGTGGSES